MLQDVLFAGLGPQRALPPPGRDEDAKYLALVSGLGVGNEAMDPQRLALVVDYLTGVLGDAREHARVSQASSGLPLLQDLGSCLKLQQS